jgi:heme/copper-type cytochrome/quinol oxidase subunit 2
MAIKREGWYYGQCSEICGVLHGFMPICVQGVDSGVFFKWLFMEESFKSIRKSGGCL